MSRLNKKGELYASITSIKALRDATGTFGSTTVNAALAVGAASMTVAAITNFAVGQEIRVGRGEETEYLRIHSATAPTGTTITFDPATLPQYAHAVGDAVVQLAATDLGHVEEGGVDLDMAGNVEDVNSATQRILLGQLAGYESINMSFGLLGYNVENLAFALGMNEATHIFGTGGATAPRTLTIDYARAREQNDIILQLLGARKDGVAVRLTAMACELDPSTSLTLARGSKAPIPVKALVTGGLLYEMW
jgi:hypothetical protein